MTPSERKEKLAQLIESPCTSDWLKGAIQALEKRDPCDAARDVQGLVTLFGFNTLKERAL